MSSEDKKNAYKKYNQKKKSFAVVYTPTDINESIRLQNYLSDNGLTANRYIKELIMFDLIRKGYF